MPNYNIHKIRARRSYNLTEIASLYGIDRKTCSRWINEGLRVIEENVKPVLVMGFDLKDFISQRQAKKKIPLKENELFCPKCHKAVIAKTGSEEIVKTGKRIGKENKEQFKKIGVCGVCGKKINRYLGICQKD